MNLVARVSGFLEKMNYIPGVPVKAGQLLFVIEPQPYQDQLKAAQAEMKSTEARLAYARAQYEKMKEAMPSRAISEIDFIQAESDYHSAIANLQNARAQLNTAQTNLNYCYIKAPFDGRVSRNLVDLQNFVGGAVQPVTLATMYKDKYMYAYFNMAYAEFEQIPPVTNPLVSKDSALALTVINAADTSRYWKGELDYTSPNVDLQTGTVTVRAILENPKEELEFEALTPPDDIYTQALAYKPSIKAAEYRLQGSQKNIRIAQSNFYPQLSFSAGLGSNYYTVSGKSEGSFSSQMKNNLNKYIGFNLSVPIFNRFATRNRVRTARLQQANLSLQLDNTKKILYKEIQQAWYNALAAESKYNSSEVAVKANEESFRLMSEKFNNGKATFVEYNESKLNLTKALSDKLQAKYDYLFRTKILDFYKGEIIE